MVDKKNTVVEMVIVSLLSLLTDLVETVPIIRRTDGGGGESIETPQYGLDLHDRLYITPEGVLSASRDGNELMQVLGLLRDGCKVTAGQIAEALMRGAREGLWALTASHKGKDQPSVGLESNPQGLTEEVQATLDWGFRGSKPAALRGNMIRVCLPHRVKAGKTAVKVISVEQAGWLCTA